MRLSISNLAWNADDDHAIAKKLLEFSITAIDIAPGKYFPDPKIATQKEISVVKKRWSDFGVDIIGMQALLFGTQGLNVFGCTKTQHSLLEHLKHVCRIGSELGATRLVFGSPKNRDRSGLSDTQTMEIAHNFFSRLASIAQVEGVIICLEPNPAHYGANFMVNSHETAQIVQIVNHHAIKMQFDTGALTINKEDPEEILNNYAELIGHVHLSEPDLVPLGDSASDHESFYSAIAKHIPTSILTIEMLLTTKEPPIESIGRALTFAHSKYLREIP